jgi:hypothetical protein
LTTVANSQDPISHSPIQPPSVAGKPSWRWPGAIGGIVLLLFVGVACGNETNSSPTATTSATQAPVGFQKLATYAEQRLTPLARIR